MRRATRGALALAVSGSLTMAACGADEADVENLSPTARLGRDAALDAGCASCHGVDWTGSIGPGWVGLAGSTVTLTDGTTVVADTAYLTEAITDPGKAVSTGWSVAMPDNTLSDDQIAQIVTFIEELAPAG